MVSRGGGGGKGGDEKKSKCFQKMASSKNRQFRME